MRKLFVSLAVAAACSLAAQEPQPAEVMRPDLARTINRYGERVERLSKGISRDAYIVGQLVMATRDLQDFQILAAIDKAHHRIKAARKRAMEEPIASEPTLHMLRGLHETMEQARLQGTMAVPETLRKEIMERTYFLQRDLFDAVDMAQREREELTSLQKKLIDLNRGLEDASMEALAATLEFIRAGGK